MFRKSWISVPSRISRSRGVQTLLQLTALGTSYVSDKKESFAARIFLNGFEERPSLRLLARFRFNLGQGQGRFQLTNEKACLLSILDCSPQIPSGVIRFSSGGKHFGGDNLHFEAAPSLHMKIFFTLLANSGMGV